ncbi:hypothetical protein BZG36_01001 [Bifiguratus adelaidae]|uniref:Uncharacterized protein n=1 Tax=Bifiguratus adelaidae TaxID=1938954 RepID=A0A261Y6F5_9FUNG|nr:hypothetical protein BZG36_01001 [Bifiguratus adelaidae]
MFLDILGEEAQPTLSSSRPPTRRSDQQGITKLHHALVFWRKTVVLERKINSLRPKKLHRRPSQTPEQDRHRLRVATTQIEDDGSALRKVSSTRSRSSQLSTNRFIGFLGDWKRIRNKSQPSANTRFRRMRYDNHLTVSIDSSDQRQETLSTLLNPKRERKETQQSVPLIRNGLLPSTERPSSTINPDHLHVTYNTLSANATTSEGLTAHEFAALTGIRIKPEDEEDEVIPEPHLLPTNNIAVPAFLSTLAASSGNSPEAQSQTSSNTKLGICDPEFWQPLPQRPTQTFSNDIESHTLKTVCDSQEITEPTQTQISHPKPLPITSPVSSSADSPQDRLEDLADHTITLAGTSLTLPAPPKDASILEPPIITHLRKMSLRSTNITVDNDTFVFPSTDSLPTDGTVRLQKATTHISELQNAELDQTQLVLKGSGVIKKGRFQIVLGTPEKEAVNPFHVPSAS